ncbi:ODA11 [Symbiodinium natans]|uniref:ODA11 protein n=1 Tax=Symbiodinium natans TaxID=878477 RepID=A0A812NQU3_9DINO|nr:ODA11 [Symbiodinium natans]
MLFQQDQLLFLVVKLERPDLARTKSELIQQQNEFKVRLADLESYLLEKLAGAEGDILEDQGWVGYPVSGATARR